MTKTLTRTITAALLIAALAVPAAAATTADIGVKKAKEAALSHAGVAESDTVFLIAEADYDDGRKDRGGILRRAAPNMTTPLTPLRAGCSSSIPSWNGIRRR